jgi:protein-disulfide isomerase
MAVAAIALYVALRPTDRLDETRVQQLIEERLAISTATGQTAAAPEDATPRQIDEARVIELIDEHVDKVAGTISDKEFNARVERGIVAFIDKQREAERERPSQLARNVPAPNKNDHIYGNPGALVTLIEYSDFECPFCKRFHSTVKRLVDESNGKVNWVYRHFPIDQLHPVKARREAVASECANELGGNEAFWKFADRFFELTPSNNRTDIDVVLPQIAREIGLEESQFAACLESGKYDKHIEEDLQSAAASGGRGTPWSIILSKNGKRYPLSGAQPYEAVKRLVELALKEK